MAVQGNLAISKRSQTVKLASDIAATTSVNEASDGFTADILTLGGSGLNAFAGVNGGFSDNAGHLNSNAIGLSLSSVEFGLALISEKPSATPTATPLRSWTSLQATAGSVGFVGLGDDLKISATGVKVDINQASVAASGQAATPVVDYASGKTALSIATGTGLQTSLSLDGAQGQLLQASGFLTLDVYGFVQVKGNLAISKTTETVTLAKKTGVATAETVKANVLSIGGSSIDVFVGVNGDTPDAIGLSLDNIDFGLALISSQSQPTRKWTALTAAASSVGLVGLSDLLPTVKNLSVELNQASQPLDQVVDFSAKNLAVKTGSSSAVTLNFDGAVGELIRAEGDVTLQISDFAYFSGRIGFEKYSPTNAIKLNNNNTLNTQTTVPSSPTTSMMAITGTGVTAFVGYADGGFDVNKTLVEQQNNLYGFGVDKLDFGVLVSKVGGQSYTALKARMDDVRLYGFDSNDFELSAQDLRFEYNSADVQGRTIDYAHSFNGGVALGSTGNIAIDFSGGKRLGVYAQTATLSISKFMYLNGAIGFEQASYTGLKSGVAGTSSVLGAKGFSIGGSNITAFVGYAENGIDHTKTLAEQAGNLYGFGADGLNFGLLSVKDSAGTKYTALKAHADNMAVYGFDSTDFQLSAASVNLEYNSASVAGSELNFSGTGRNLSIATGDSSQPVTLDFAGKRIGVFAGQATLRISQFMYAQGSIGFQKAEFTDMVAGSATPLGKLTGFTIGGSDIDVFVGYAGNGFDQKKSFADQANTLYGFGAEGIDFGVIQLKSVAGVKYTAAKAHADTAKLYGFDPSDFELSLKGIDFQVNTVTGVGPAINFTKTYALTSGFSNRIGYELPTGNIANPILLDMKAETIGASLNSAT